MRDPKSTYNYHMSGLYELVSEHFLQVASHLTDTRVELDLLDQVFREHGVRSVCDVACGAGRHSVPLAEMGYRVTGIDISETQLNYARQLALSKDVNPEFLRGDANDFTLANEVDAAICMWTTLGEDPLRYQRVMKNVACSLKDKGIFVIDNRSWLHIPEKKEAQFTNITPTPEGEICEHIHDTFTENHRVRIGTLNYRGETHRLVCVTELLREEDWIEALRTHGNFREFEVYHDYSPVRAENPKRVQIVAIK